MQLGRVMLAGAAILVLAGTALAASQWSADRPGFFLGLALLIVGALSLVVSPLISRRANLEHAYEAGYDAGFSRGRRAGRPKVVPMRHHKAAQKR